MSSPASTDQPTTSGARDRRIRPVPSTRLRASLAAGLAALMLVGVVALGGVRHASAVASLHGGSLYRVDETMSAVRAQDEPFVPPGRMTASRGATRDALPGAVFPSALPFHDIPLWWPLLAGFGLVAIAVALPAIRRRRQ
jgi:hypothetical protein